MSSEEYVPVTSIRRARSHCTASWEQPISRGAGGMLAKTTQSFSRMRSETGQHERQRRDAVSYHRLVPALRLRPPTKARLGSEIHSRLLCGCRQQEGAARGLLSRLPPGTMNPHQTSHQGYRLSLSGSLLLPTRIDCMLSRWYRITDASLFNTHSLDITVMERFRFETPSEFLNDTCLEFGLWLVERRTHS